MMLDYHLAHLRVNTIFTVLSQESENPMSIFCKIYFVNFFSTQDVEVMKKDKESLDQQLRSMGINPPQGPSYLPTPAEMRPGPSLSFIGQDKDNMLSVRDRSLTTESYAGDLSEGMFVSTKDGPKTKPSIRIRSSSESEVPENKANSQQSTRTSLVSVSETFAQQT